MLNYNVGDVVIVTYGEHGERLGVVTRVSRFIDDRVKVLSYVAVTGRWNRHAYYARPVRLATALDLVRVRLDDRVVFNTRVRHYGGDSKP